MSPSEFIASARASSPSLPPDIIGLVEVDEEFRHAVCLELNKDVGASDRALARHILKLYIRSHGGDGEWGMSDEIRLSALLLYKIANVEDAPLLWEAKSANFDTYCGLDVQLLVGAGVEETLAYLKGLGDEKALAASKYIEACRDTGDFGDLHEYAGWWDGYFGG